MTEGKMLPIMKGTEGLGFLSIRALGMLTGRISLSSRLFFGKTAVFERKYTSKRAG
jgi:hypothetical protein